jgi:hypothetical protein
MCLETNYALSLVLKPFPTCLCLDLDSPSARLLHRVYRIGSTVLKPLKYFAKPSNDKIGIVDRFNGIGALGKVSVAGGKVVWSGPELLDLMLPWLAVLFYVVVFVASLATFWWLTSRSQPGSVQNGSATRRQAERGDVKSRSRPMAA